MDFAVIGVALSSIHGELGNVRPITFVAEAMKRLGLPEPKWLPEPEPEPMSESSSRAVLEANPRTGQRGKAMCASPRSAPGSRRRPKSVGPTRGLGAGDGPRGACKASNLCNDRSADRAEQQLRAMILAFAVLWMLQYPGDVSSASPNS